MLLTSTQVTEEFIKYGLINEGESIPGVEGLIKNIAIVISSEFSFAGEKTDRNSIYAFPRKNMSPSNKESQTPNCVYEAQLYSLIHDKSSSFLSASFNRNQGVSYLDEGPSEGLSWSRKSIKSFELYKRVEEILYSVIAIDQVSSSFELKSSLSKSILSPLIIRIIDNMTVSNNVYSEAAWNDNLDAASKNAIRDKIEDLTTALFGKINTSDIVDMLTDESTSSALSANQGKVLKGLVDAATVTVVDVLNSTSTTSALSANQGKFLKTLVDAVSTVIVRDVLTSTSSADALSANQGKVLNDLITSSAVTVVDVLDSTSTSDALSAKQGKSLKTLVDAVSSIVVEDVLSSSSTTNALSSNQGKVLKDLIDSSTSVVAVEDNLTSTATTNSLSANQGRALKSLIDSIVHVTVDDVLNSTSTTNALSANQGRSLKMLYDGITHTTVTDSLVSTSTTEALSANQGKELKALIDGGGGSSSSSSSVYCAASTAGGSSYYNGSYIGMTNILKQSGSFTVDGNGVKVPDNGFYKITIVLTEKGSNSDGTTGSIKVSHDNTTINTKFSLYRYNTNPQVRVVIDVIELTAGELIEVDISVGSMKWDGGKSANSLIIEKL
jgi:hypothetical protein